MKCAYVEDLYHLYQEGLTSEETKQDIEEHLEDCGDCQKKLLAPVPEIKSQGELTEAESTATEKKAIRRYKKKFFGIIAVAVALALVVGGGGVFGYNYYQKHPHTVYSLSVPSQYDKINFKSLSNTIFHTSGVFRGTIVTVGNGVIVQVRSDGSIKNIQCMAYTQDTNQAKQKVKTSLYQTDFTKGDSQKGKLKISQTYTYAESGKHQNIYGRDPKEVFAAYSSLPIEHVLKNIGVSNYRCLTITNSDQFMGDLNARVDGMDMTVSIGVTPSEQLKCFMINRSGTIEPLTSETIVDSREYVTLFVSANMDGNSNIDQSLTADARLAYVIEL
jgi:hypothetical protein